MSTEINSRRYAITYVAVMVGLVVLNLILAMAFDYSLPTGLVTILPAMMAAMIEGRKLADAGVTELPKADAWRLARQMTLVALYISLVVFVLFLLIPDLAGVMRQVPVVLLLVVFVALALVTFLVNRIFVGMGFKNQHRVLEKQNGT